jgi:hypothetical protein
MDNLFGLHHFFNRRLGYLFPAPLQRRRKACLPAFLLRKSH